MNTRIQDLSSTRLLTGAALIAAGALAGLQAVGLLHFLDLARSWPLFVIVLAFVKIGATLRERRWQGWGLLLAGDWLLANTMTDWVYVQFSVPMLLAGFGLFTIIGAPRGHSRRSDENRYAIQ